AHKKRPEIVPRARARERHLVLSTGWANLSRSDPHRALCARAGPTTHRSWLLGLFVSDAWEHATTRSRVGCSQRKEKRCCPHRCPDTSRFGQCVGTQDVIR